MSGAPRGSAPSAVALLALLVLALAGCGARRPAPREGGGEAAVVDEAAGIRLMALERPTEGRVWLSLWVDAGARDAEAPAAAALAAWVATADRPEIHARALADGIELSRECERERLDACLAELAAALSTRRVDEGALAAARRRLSALRRRTAGDAARTADALALAALLGGPADPLAGEGSPGPDAVAAFLERHFGAGRALLVAVGDVERETLRARVERAFDAVPQASATRAERPDAPQRGVAVEVGDASVLSVATFRPSPADARALGHRLLARLAPDLAGARASADVFPVRGGTVLLARVHARTRGGRAADAPGPAAATLLSRLAELLDEAPAVAGPARPAERPAALARWLGARWVTRAARGSELSEPRTGGLGVGAVVDGGRADAVDLEDPDARTREDARRRLGETVAAAFAAPALEGRVTAEEVDASFRGARIRARRVPGAAAVGVAALFEGGAAEEDASVHGATALLATVAARGCERVAAEELGARLDALGVEVEPVLGPRGWGLSVVGPKARWAALTYLAPRCAEIPHLSAREVELARAALRARAEDDALRGAVAPLLSPGVPGRVAPAGSAAALGGLGVGELRRWRDGRVAARRARVAVVGDVPVEAAAERVARRVARWPEGAPPERAPWVAAEERLRALARDGELAAAIGWVAPAEVAAAPVARAFAAAVARSLAAEPGLSPRWSEGGAVDGRAWAAVGVRADAEALDELPARAARAVRAIAHGWAEIAARAVRSAARERAWAGASVDRLAVALALDRPAPPEAGDARAVLERLAEAPAVFVVARPAPGGRD